MFNFFKKKEKRLELDDYKKLLAYAEYLTFDEYLQSKHRKKYVKDTFYFEHGFCAQDCYDFLTIKYHGKHLALSSFRNGLRHFLDGKEATDPELTTHEIKLAVNQLGEHLFNSLDHEINRRLTATQWHYVGEELTGDINFHKQQNMKWL